MNTTENKKDKKQTSVRWPAKMYEQLEYIAQRKGGISVAGLIRIAVQEYIDRETSKY